MERSPHLPKLARIYGVERSTMHRWAKRNLPITDPVELARVLASQDRPGKTLLRLTTPDTLRETISQIESL